MKKRIFSGVQPSGNLHIGNYLGAIKNWVKLQDEYDSVFCVVDLHAITVPQDPEELRKKTIEVAKIYLAAGIDPEKCSIFIQSHVPEHTELTWILNTIAKNGELSRMTQFKVRTGFNEDVFEKGMREKANEKITEILARNKITIKLNTNVNDLANAIHKTTLDSAIDTYKKYVQKPFNDSPLGLFDYPVLMAADILLYNTDLVPVGKDQVQHIELTRALAERFNKQFEETFKIPKPHTTKESENIMGLDDPTKKMSKSADSEYNYISLTDDEETVRRKIKKAVTDSGSEIRYVDDPSKAEAGKPALRNLINIYSLLTDKKPEEIEKDYQDKNYAEFKEGLADAIVDFLKPFQEKMNSLSDDEVLEILKEGADKVRPIAQEKMKEVKEKIGLIA